MNEKLATLTQSETNLILAAYHNSKLSNARLASYMGISKQTVDNMFSTIYSKLGIEGRGKRTQLMWAVEPQYNPETGTKTVLGVLVAQESRKWAIQGKDANGNYVGLLPFEFATQKDAEAFLAEGFEAYLDQLGFYFVEPVLISHTEHFNTIAQAPLEFDLEYNWDVSHLIEHSEDDYKNGLLQYMLDKKIIETSGDSAWITTIDEGDFEYEGQRFVVEQVLSSKDDPTRWCVREM